VARLVDLDRRTALLDDVVTYLGEHGLANVSLRPMAATLGVSVNSLVHHFGSKDDLIITALRRSGAIQRDVEHRWLARRPRMSQADLLRAWWRWITASPRNLAIVRLGIEATTTEATLEGLPRQVRGEQIGVWRSHIEDRLVAEGVPTETAVIEASLAKARPDECRPVRAIRSCCHPPSRRPRMTRGPGIRTTVWARRGRPLPTRDVRLLGARHRRP